MARCHQPCGGMPLVHAAIDFVVAIASLVAILDYFGIRPNEQPRWGLKMPMQRNWKLGLMLSLVTASLGMSGYGLYRSSITCPEIPKQVNQPKTLPLAPETQTAAPVPVYIPE